MTNPFIETIESPDAALRNRPFSDLCAPLSPQDLLAACGELETFRRNAENLYERVRATLFLHAIHRFHLSESPAFAPTGPLPFEGFSDLLGRRFEEAIACFLRRLDQEPSGTLFSALADAYHQLSFDTLSEQVRRSVRASRGNQWMFRVGHADAHPLRIQPEMLQREDGRGLFPILVEKTPVRLDLSHSGWSDIFFLGMDFPECARVLNISVDLGVHGRDRAVSPPVESYVRVIPEPLLRLTSIDLECHKDITSLQELFNFGNDYLSLLKAGVIASGLVPPSFEGTGQSLSLILAEVLGAGMGLELVTKVNDIPKGSRLAVSTNLLASMIAAIMRATGQIRAFDGPLAEEERRLIASRAILGEWLGGSGGGWQDSGGVWPGLKVIEGAEAQAGDPEFGVSRGRLLPQHRILGKDDLHPEIQERLAQSLVLIHGGMAQNVGPILEMVTEKYLLRGAREWEARQETRDIFEGILAALKAGDVHALAQQTTANWDGPLKAIIPWVTNRFTETIIGRARKRFGEDFWGFLMLGGMSGGGMGMFCAPERREEFRDGILEIMTQTKEELAEALPFAMNPVVYDFRINPQGTKAQWHAGGEAFMPTRYYGLQTPQLVQAAPGDVGPLRTVELDRYTAQCRDFDETYPILRTLVGHLFRAGASNVQGERQAWDRESARIKSEHGFDGVQHEQIREDLRRNRIGLAHNRLPVDTEISDVEEQDVTLLEEKTPWVGSGETALREGRVAVMSLAAGVGSRWTSGAGVIKAINPFVAFQGRQYSFLGLHVAKTKQSAQRFGAAPPHIVSTSYLTHGPIEKHLAMEKNFGYAGDIYLSPGRSIGQRLIPMVRDLVFLWEEMPQESLDEQKQKVRDAVRGALMDWAHAKGEGSDYVDNVPIQRFSPPGHWYEVPNLLRNGVLARLLKAHPKVETLMLHNIDTLGADLDPTALGAHLDSGNTLSFEVVPRRICDRGGGLARVNGQARLLEGLAQPREEDELKLRYYNSMTTWIQIDALLEQFELCRDDLRGAPEKIDAAVRAMARRMPTYVTIKDVKFRWGHGQEDIYPVAQFEKLWSDMTALPGMRCGYLVAPRMRGQQLKDADQLDAWLNDGSQAHIAERCGLSTK
jgi:hypothetical protein